jgi:CheY-like chemotaxis protein
VKRFIVAAVDDLFFQAKIRAAAEHLNAIVRFARSVPEVMELAHEELPMLIVVDLHAHKFDPLQLARELKADEARKHIPLLGFYSHVEAQLRRRAIEAGYKQVIARSAFAKNLADILQPDANSL